MDPNSPSKKYFLGALGGGKDTMASPSWTLGGMAGLALVDPPAAGGPQLRAGRQSAPPLDWLSRRSQRHRRHMRRAAPAWHARPTPGWEGGEGGSAALREGSLLPTGRRVSGRGASCRPAGGSRGRHSPTACLNTY